jgi:hypothetical protein
MKRRILLLAALTFVGLRPSHAQEAPSHVIPAVSTSASQAYPQVTCTSADALACTDALQLASDARDQLSSLLRLGPAWRFPVHIHILTADDPLTAKIDHEAAAVFSQRSSMKIEAVLPPNDPNAREFIQRQFVTALLWEKFFANTKTFDKNTRLDVVPLWLVEGLRESLNEDPEHNRESIVRRAVQSQSTSTLDDITHWHQLSDDRLLGLWQRAFCYYLVDSLTRQGAHRDDFQLWLDGFSGSNPSSQFHFPTEADWQHELVDASKRSHDILYTWTETLSELTAAQTITYAASKDAKVQTCALDNAITLPRTPPVLEALKERIFLLTQLELRAHPSWHSILELYRSALTALVDDNHPDVARGLLEEAHRRSVAEMANHQKLLDYVNWFEVTKDNSEGTTRFGTYFDTAKSMEKVEADPTHPNPIRANLLEIESQL